MRSRPLFTPYWITFELPSIDVKAASIGILDQVVAGLRQCSLRRTRGGSCEPRPSEGKTRESSLLKA
jgi:hypothetical protein